jgi:hypothetical protein
MKDRQKALASALRYRERHKAQLKARMAAYHRAHGKAARRAQRAEWKTLGLCCWCGGPRVPGIGKCAACQAKQRAAERTRRAAQGRSTQQPSERADAYADRVLHKLAVKGVEDLV